MIAGLWSQDPFSHQGQHYQLKRATLRRARSNSHARPSCSAARPPRRVCPSSPRATPTNTTSAWAPRRRAGPRARGSTAPAPSSGAIRRPCRCRSSPGVCVGATEPEVARDLALLMEGARPHMQNLDTWITGTPDKPPPSFRALGAAGVRRLMFSVEHERHSEMVALLGERVLPLVNASA